MRCVLQIFLCKPIFLCACTFQKKNNQDCLTRLDIPGNKTLDWQCKINTNIVMIQTNCEWPLITSVLFKFVHNGIDFSSDPNKNYFTSEAHNQECSILYFNLFFLSFFFLIHNCSLKIVYKTYNVSKRWKIYQFHFA